MEAEIAKLRRDGHMPQSNPDMSAPDRPKTPEERPISPDQIVQSTVSKNI